MHAYRFAAGLHPCVAVACLIAVAACSDDAVTPRVGELRVTVSTTGVDQDPDGYGIALNQSTPVRVGINDAVTFTIRNPGSHSVTLSGVAPNCAPSSAATLPAQVAAGSLTTVDFAVSCSLILGAVRVRVVTEGDGAADVLGLSLQLDQQPAVTLAASDTIVLEGLAPGVHSVTLGGEPDHCTIEPASPVSVTVLPADTVDVAFTVTCPAVGYVRVTTTTTGPGLPMTVNIISNGVGTLASVAPGMNSTRVSEPVQGGSYAVVFSQDLPDNCAVESEYPVSVTVTHRDTAEVAFVFTCAPVTQVLYADSGALAVLNLESGGYFVLTNDTKGCCVSAAWAPDGRRIAYSDGAGMLHLLDLDTARDSIVELANSDTEWAPAWRADGVFLVFRSEPGGQLWEMEGILAGPVTGTQVAQTGWPAWNPVHFGDIVYDCPVDGQIDICRFDGSIPGQVSLTDDPALDTEPSWSPDGSTLVFRTCRYAEECSLALIDRASGEITEVPNTIGARAPAWSPDGTLILFTNAETCQPGSCYLYTIQPDGTDSAVRYLHTRPMYRPTWRPPVS